MQNQNLTTSKLPKETEQQYTAWLLYCEAGSLRKTLEVWSKVGQLWGEIGADFALKLGKKPGETTIENWSKKYHWVERRELKVTEDLETLRDKTKKIRREKIHKIADIFERVINKKIRQLKEGESVTMLDLKQIWEMFQVELGKPTSRGELKTESEQKPLTSEEKEHGKRVHKAVKWYLDNELDKEDKWQEFQKLIEKNKKKR